MTLEIITADSLLPIRHGFFTRKGGASSGVFAGLNCGRGSSDQRAAVNINRARAASAVGVELEFLCGVHQIHSATVATLDGRTDDPAPKADAVVTAQPGLALGILTADCAPVLFADQSAGVIGAAHAGWRGALSGVLENTLAAMEACGAERDRINAVVGPTISQRNYEVGPDFMDEFTTENADFGQFFANGAGDRLQFDLPAFVLHRLRASGVGSAEWTRHCTYADPDLFYSYRRSLHRKEADYGRMISLISM